MRLSNNYNGSRLPRHFAGAVSIRRTSAIGMIEPVHCAGVLAEGWTKRSGGTALKFLAGILMARGCEQVFNLDGGQTFAAVCLGDLVMEALAYNGFANTRRRTDIIGTGTSDQVKKYEPKKQALYLFCFCLKWGMSGCSGLASPVRVGYNLQENAIV